jgi:hypothetical protein
MGPDVHANEKLERVSPTRCQWWERDFLYDPSIMMNDPFANAQLQVGTQVSIYASSVEALSAHGQQVGVNDAARALDECVPVIFTGSNAAYRAAHPAGTYWQTDHV